MSCKGITIETFNDDGVETVTHSKMDMSLTISVDTIENVEESVFDIEILNNDIIIDGFKFKELRDHFLATTKV